MNGTVIKDSIIPTILSLGSDPIPNIRFSVAKAIGVITPILKKANLGQVMDEQAKPLLLKMQEDKDADVKYFAAQSLLAF